MVTCADTFLHMDDRVLYPCMFCGKSMATASGLSRHQQMSTSCRQKLQELISSYNITAFDDYVQPAGDPKAGCLNAQEDREMHLFADVPFIPPPDPNVREHVRTCEYMPTVEPDHDDHPSDQDRFVQDFPKSRQAGVPIDSELNGTMFDKAKAELGDSPWYPFENEEDWQLAEWLSKRVGQNAIDEFLKLPIVSQQCQFLLIWTLTNLPYTGRQKTRWRHHHIIKGHSSVSWTSSQ